MSNISEYVLGVHRVVDEAVEALECDVSQRRLLEATVRRMQGHASGHPLSDPLAMIALVALAHDRELDAQAVDVGAFCFLYIAALDLFDDVQDEDLAGKPHAEVGAPIAINSAITLLFLALSVLGRALAAEVSASRRLRLMALFHRVSLAAATGQHLDLLGHAGAQTPQDVLRMQQAKTSSMALVAECGALLAGCDEAGQARFREVGEQLAAMVQIIDDLRDIFGKEQSPDLLTGCVTYPVACLQTTASPDVVARFLELKRGLPDTLSQIRDLMFERQIVERCALAIDECRRRIHDAVASSAGQGGYLRLFLNVVDGLASAIYEPEAVASSAPLWAPTDEWSRAVREQAARAGSRMQAHGLPAPPELRPWHLPHYLYEPEQACIYYPDVDGLAAEILPFQAGLLGCDDLDEVRAIMLAQLPAVIAHELFHYWRHTSGRLTADSWHEEHAANKLAVAYCREYEPGALDSALVLAGRMRERFAGSLTGLDELLEQCAEPRGELGYDMNMQQAAIVHLEMVRRLASMQPVLAQEVELLLRRPHVGDVPVHSPRPVELLP